MAYLTALQPQNLDEAVGLYHASPRDPVWEYVLSSLQAELCLDAQPARIALIGHSHVALAFWRLPGAAATGQTPMPTSSTSARGMADQPRQRRPAPRRRPARGLARA